MKTIVIYTFRRNGSYDELYAALAREGVRRGWRFAFVEPVFQPQLEENERIRRILDVLKPAGFVGGYVTTKHNDIPQELPSVWIDCHWAPLGKPEIRHDNAAFGAAAARALIDGGENYAAFGLKPHPWSSQRIRAFAAALSKQGLCCHRFGLRCRRFQFDTFVDGQYTVLGDVRDALKRLPRPVSVFAVTDALAGIVLMAAESLGWHCPGDIRIVGVDDNELQCTASPVTLSSVHPDWAEGGRLAVEALAAQMRGERTKRIYLYGAAGVTRRASTRDAYRRPRDERVERALVFIHDRFSTPISIADVVAEMGCSRSLADLRFREETGKSILETIEDLRWERLKTILKRSRVDLRQVPQLVGYENAAALRAFVRRRSGGLSMTALRAANAVVP